MAMFLKTLAQTYASLVLYLPYLAIGTLLAASIRVYVDRDNLGRFLQRSAAPSIFLVTLVGAVTPFCSCGTTAVVLSMLASTVPWGPIVAFMVSSPLMSPGEFLQSAGILGWNFAVAQLVSSLLLGVAAGYAAHWLQKRGFLENQARLLDRLKPSGEKNPAPARGSASLTCGCDGSPGAAAPAGPIGTQGVYALTPNPACLVWPARHGRLARFSARLKLRDLAGAMLHTGTRLILLYLAFSLIGHLLIALLPSQWLVELFGRSKFYAVPFAATVGLPIYINAEVSMPLLKTFVQAGMSPGAALAFIIAGAGTSVGAISGAFVIARRRVVGLVVASLWLGAIVSGYLYNLYLMFSHGL